MVHKYILELLPKLEHGFVVLDAWYLNNQKNFTELSATYGGVTLTFYPFMKWYNNFFRGIIMHNSWEPLRIHITCDKPTEWDVNASFSECQGFEKALANVENPEKDKNLVIEPAWVYEIIPHHAEANDNGKRFVIGHLNSKVGSHYRRIHAHFSPPIDPSQKKDFPNCLIRKFVIGETIYVANEHPDESGNIDLLYEHWVNQRQTKAVLYDSNNFVTASDSVYNVHYTCSDGYTLTIWVIRYHGFHYDIKGPTNEEPKGKGTYVLPGRFK